MILLELLYFVDPYTKEEHDKFKKLYLEYLKNNPYEIYLRTLKLVFGK